MNSDSRQLELDIKLRDDATFASYIGEAGERLAGMHGIVYLWGRPGTGRSHLAQAACHKARNGGRSFIYLSEPAHFAADVLAGLEQLDLVCIDDVHTVAGDEAWEVALFHLINSVVSLGGTLLFAADCPAQALAVRLPDLKSRLLVAHTLETDHLDDAQKLSVLQQKALTQGFDLSDEVGRFIMSRTERDMHSLMTLLARLEVETLRQQKRLTIPFVKSILQSQ